MKPRNRQEEVESMLGMLMHSLEEMAKGCNQLADRVEFLEGRVAELELKDRKPSIASLNEKLLAFEAEKKARASQPINRASEPPPRRYIK